jgi:hypothetical protein
MSISNYTELKSAISDWMARSDISGSEADFITLAEARLNRLLEPVPTNATLIATPGSRYIDVSSLSIIEPIALHFTGVGPELIIIPKAEGSFEYTDVEGLPTIYTLGTDQIVFDCPSSSDYSFRFTYSGKFRLSDAAPTNELLTNHPDVYLAASIVWGAGYVKDNNAVAGWKSLLDEFIAETNHQYAKSKRSLLTVDNGLRPRRYWDYAIGDYR